MSYRIEWEREAIAALDGLDASIARDILRRVHWLSVNFDSVKPKALAGRLKGYFRLRAGDYRIVYSVDRAKRILVINLVGHRRDIYCK